MEKIRVLLADEYPVILEALRNRINSEDDMEVVGEALNGSLALRMAEEIKPDILVIDTDMPQLSGFQVLGTLRTIMPVVNVLFFTGLQNPESFIGAMRLGCKGITRKQGDPGLVLDAIRKIHKGEVCIDSETTTLVLHQFSSEPEVSQMKGCDRNNLSAREKEIVTLVAQGYKNKEMAESMCISEQTIKNHLHNIFDKLGVRDRVALAIYGIRKGLHLMEISKVA